jgi:hypothetical protein
MRYRMSDGTIVDTDRASKSWAEDTRFDGRNHISCATGDQWVHERLYRSRRGRYYIVRTSQWQGSSDSAEWVSLEEAARWLLAAAHLEPTDPDFPADLRPLVDEVTD